MATYLIVTANLIIMASTMFISYIILTVKLKQTKSTIKTAQRDRVNSKVTTVCWIMVTLWLILTLPLIILSQVITKIPYTNFVGTFHDVTFLIYCLSNIANPILYAITMKDFREGYKALLLCTKVQPRNESVNTVSRTGSTMIGSIGRGVQDSKRKSTNDRK